MKKLKIVELWPLLLLLVAILAVATFSCGNGGSDDEVVPGTISDRITALEVRADVIEDTVKGLPGAGTDYATSGELKTVRNNLTELRNTVEDLNLEPQDLTDLEAAMVAIELDIAAIEALKGLEEGLGVEPLNLTFIVNEESGVHTQTFHVETFGQELMWVANASYTDWPPYQWLAISPSIGNSTVDILVSVNAGDEVTHLEPGAYHADIDVLSVSDMAKVSITLYVVEAPVP